MTAGERSRVRGLPMCAHLACVCTRFPTKEVLCLPSMFTPSFRLPGSAGRLDMGIPQVFVASPQGDQRKVIDFFGQEVLPHLQRGELTATT